MYLFGKLYIGSHIIKTIYHLTIFIDVNIQQNTKVKEKK